MEWSPVRRFHHRDQNEAPDQTTVQLARDAQGFIEKVTNPLNHDTEFEYDDRGNLTKVTYADLTEATSTYDRFDRTTVATDPNGDTTSFDYDPDGWLAALTDARGHTTRWTPFNALPR